MGISLLKVPDLLRICRIIQSLGYVLKQALSPGNMLAAYTIISKPQLLTVRSLSLANTTQNLFSRGRGKTAAFCHISRISSSLSPRPPYKDCSKQPSMAEYAVPSSHVCTTDTQASRAPSLQYTTSRRHVRTESPPGPLALPSKACTSSAASP